MTETKLAQSIWQNTTLMVQGTTSDAGKSVLAAALCRILSGKGVRVAPFKPQNMSLNSAVTPEGGEIGRAQALQAQACRINPQVHMNPVLIKPSSDTQAQVIIQGKALHDFSGAQFHQYKKIAKTAVLDSYQQLKVQYDTLIVEGAGSPAEINLREGDIANMGFAESVDCPVILIADIDRGGVFAHLVGTLALLSQSEQDRVIGFVINRFRGDIALLQSGLDWLEDRTGKPVLGVIPYVDQLYLDAEDSISTQQQQHEVKNKSDKFKVVVPVFSRISNHTDFDVLRLNKAIDLQFVSLKQPPPACDLIILPGTKNVREDLALLKQAGWVEDILKHLRYGGKLIGICGGYQMLGHWIDDPKGIESTPGRSGALGLLPITTVLQPKKQLKTVTGTLCLNGSAEAFQGYEIHCGISSYLPNHCQIADQGIADLERQPDNCPPIHINHENQTVFDGCINADNNIFGCYIHGLFDNAKACEALLQWAGAKVESASFVDLNTERDCQLNRWALIVNESLNLGNPSSPENTPSTLEQAIAQFYNRSRHHDRL